MKNKDTERELQTPCFSWEGEDVLAMKIMRDFLGVEKGRYVDIGAHHPIQYSNTHLFYQQGWRGVNIDATPHSMDLFNQFRPEDINLEIGISAKAGDYPYYMFENSMLNGILSEETVQQHIARGEQLIEQSTIPCKRINDVLADHIPAGELDLISVDIEGQDLAVLQDFDFERWRPKLIIVEILGPQSLEAVLMSPEVAFLNSVNYKLFSRLHFSSIFIDADAMPGGRD